MTLNVQGAAGSPWPDPTTQATLQAAQAQPQPLPQHHHQGLQHDTYTVAPAQPVPDGYEAMRLRAYRRDANETAGITTQSTPETATASTAAAPAVRTDAAQTVNPAITAPQAPAPYIERPRETPAIQAVEAP